eukprot:697680_1
MWRVPKQAQEEEEEAETMSRKSEGGKLAVVAAFGLIGIAGATAYQLYENNQRNRENEKKKQEDRKFKDARRRSFESHLEGIFYGIKMCGQNEALSGEDGFRAQMYRESPAAGDFFKHRLSTKTMYMIFTFCELHELANLQSVCTRWPAFLSKIMLDRKYLRACARRGFKRSIRGKCWVHTSGAQLREQGAYQYLRDRANVESVEEKEDHDVNVGRIGRDLARTMPTHEFFQNDAEGQQRLLNIMKAYMVHDKEVGYVQGMNFIGAILCMKLSEEEAFWMFNVLMTTYDVRSNFLEQLPRLKLSLYQFDELLGVYLPDLYQHFKVLDIPPTLYASEWFLTLFGCCFPLESVEQIWDMFFVDSWMVVHSVGLAILFNVQGKLLGMDFDDTLRFLKRQILESVTDMEKLIRDSHHFDIDTAQLDMLQHQFMEKQLFLEE